MLKDNKFGLMKRGFLAIALGFAMSGCTRLDIKTYGYDDFYYQAKDFNVRFVYKEHYFQSSKEVVNPFHVKVTNNSPLHNDLVFEVHIQPQLSNYDQFVVKSLILSDGEKVVWQRQNKERRFDSFSDSKVFYNNDGYGFILMLEKMPYKNLNIKMDVETCIQDKCNITQVNGVLHTKIFREEAWQEFKHLMSV